MLSEEAWLCDSAWAGVNARGKRGTVKRQM